jgi:hypothetical protein
VTLIGKLESERLALLLAGEGPDKAGPQLAVVGLHSNKVACPNIGTRQITERYPRDPEGAGA